MSRGKFGYLELGHKRMATVALLLAVALAVTGCGSSNGLTAADVDADRSSPDLASTSWMAAAAGSDLVFVLYPEESTGPLPTAVRAADGSISSLPSLPFVGDVRISTVGESVAVGGVECLDKGCDESVPAFAVLTKDRSSWRRVDSPDTRLSGEVELAALSVGRHEVGLFQIGPSTYAVTPSGEVAIVPQSPVSGSEYGFSCVAGDTMIALDAAGVKGAELAGMTSEVELIDDVYTLRLGSLEDGWQSSGAVPQGVRTPLSKLCLPSSLSLQTGDTEVSFNAEDGTWKQNPSNLLALVSSPVFRFGVESVASSADGSVDYLVDGGRLLSQSQSGVWVDTSKKASQVWGTSDSVIVYDNSSRTFQSVGSN